MSTITSLATRRKRFENEIGQVSRGSLRFLTMPAWPRYSVSPKGTHKMLPVLAGILVSGLMRSGSTGASASPAQPAPSGGNLGDILGQIFGRGTPGSPGTSAGPAQQVPPPGSQPAPPSGQPIPLPIDPGGQVGADGDLLGSILREFEKGIREGRIKPVIIGGGPFQIPLPGGEQGPNSSRSDAPQMPGGDILGQILRDVLGGGAGGPTQMPQGGQTSSPSMKELSDLSEQLGRRGGVGAAVFGDHFETGREIERSHVDNIQSVFDRYLGAQGR
jgi:hypothetical protein